jgi:preprotein translocase subunit SecE
MARKRRGNDDDDNPEVDLADDEPTPSKAASSPRTPRAARARPGPQAREQKAGSYTKAVKQGRARKFTSEVVAEMRKVSWPNRKQLAQATMVVLVAIAIIAAFLGLADQASDWIVDRIFQLD